MKLTTDFETGSGRITQLDTTRFRLDTVGDPFGYNRYFCVRAHNDADTLQPVELEIYPDPDLQDSHFMTHFPGHLWWGHEDGSRWVPLRNTWEDSVSFAEDHITLRVPLLPNQTLLLATNPPLPYSKLLAWMDGLQGRADVRVGSIGKSHEERDIPVLRIGKAGKPRMLVLAGMHSSEHSGVYASHGIAQYLLSTIAEAQPLKDELDIAIVPMLNPDGNVRGYSGGNHQRLSINNSLDFVNASEGQPQQYVENARLWDWLCSEFAPDFALHFHGYLGWRRGGDHPYDGLYALQDPASVLSEQRAKQHSAMVDRLIFDTPAYSAHWGTTGGILEDMLEHQLAKQFDAAGLLYEVNAGSQGPGAQFRRGPEVFTAIAKALLTDLA